MGNKVTVTIYGKEYTIAGDKPREEIIKLAAHVDDKMQEIADSCAVGAMSSIAVLAAVNICDEYFDLKDKLDSLEKRNSKLDDDNQKYIQLWEEAKTSFSDQKEQGQRDMSNLREETRKEVEEIRAQKDQLLGRLNGKDKELEELIRRQQDMKAEIEKGSKEAVAETEQKYRDMENNYFDLQMENTQLKSELEKMKNDMEWERNERESR